MTAPDKKGAILGGKMKYKILKPHRQAGIDYRKGELREVHKQVDVDHLTKRGVIELVVEKKEGKKHSKKDK
ncbi:MAG TPA: hypothetical protein VL020_07100 [Pseudomonadales bacterium]|nr:hypothetical protein [Pseudomonadales bacterium]